MVTAQFIIFDGLRGLLAVAPSDLSLILDVFQATNQLLIATSSLRRTNIYIRPWHLGHICYLRVAQDRLSFYEGWDEVSESWVDAIDYLDDGL